MAVQEGLTSIRVSWSPPTPLGDTIGYRIYYSDSDSSDSVDVGDGSTDNYLLTGLEMEATYTISIVAISEHLPSDTAILEIMLGEVWCSTIDYFLGTLFFASSLIPRSAKSECSLHNSYLHLPRLECSQWHSSDQLWSDVESTQ